VLRSGSALLAFLACGALAASPASQRPVTSPGPEPSGKEIVTHRDLAYASVEGVDPGLLSLDLYTTRDAAGRPVLVMIHGGGWARGDKGNRSMTARKVPHFVGHGFVYVSINYRLSNEAGVQHPTHVQDVARALVWLHDHVREYGGDPERLFVMGHSAGAHLAALVCTDERRLKAEGKELTIVEGTICLDTAAYDIPRYVNDLDAGPSALELYERAFGTDEELWRDASPRHHVAPGKAIPPMLVFHTGNREAVETLSNELVEALREAGTPSRAIHAADRNHAGINRCIGEEDDPYTAAIMEFLADPRGVAEPGPVEDPGAVTPPAGEPPTVVVDYDPLSWAGEVELETIERDARDEERERELPLLIYPPATAEPAPVVLFSHGLGGSRHGSAYLGEHWAARGYVAVFLQHPGSDESVWVDLPPTERMAAMKRAASWQNLLLRVQDVSSVLDLLRTWNDDEADTLFGRLDLERVGLCGHSFGAVTTQAVGGQSAGRRGRRFTDERIDAALAMSPSCPARLDPARSFGSVEIPWMLMTGTEDHAAIGDQDPASRLRVYPNLPATIDRYELVLKDAEHSAFTERALPGDRQQRNPNHHRVILALSTAFWDAVLRGDAEARAWLHGTGARAVLESGDRWQLSAAATGEDVGDSGSPDEAGGSKRRR